MVVYLHEALENRLNSGRPLTEDDLEQATIEGVMKPIAAPILGGMITSTIHVLILVPVFFLLIKRRELRTGRIRPVLHDKPAEQLATTQ